jgi:hypothetical protein
MIFFVFFAGGFIPEGGCIDVMAIFFSFLNSRMNERFPDTLAFDFTLQPGLRQGNS